MKFKVGDKKEFTLPDGKDVTPQQRKKLVQEILDTKIELDGRVITVEEYFIESDDATKSTLGNLAYYMTVHHRTEEELLLEEEDRETSYDNLSNKKTSTNGILSKNEEREMERGFYATKDSNGKNTTKKRYDVFSNLDITDKNKLGVDQFKDNKDRHDPSDNS